MTTPLEADIANRLTLQLEVLAGLLGGDVYDVHRERPARVAPVLAAQLVGTDRQLAAQTAIDLSGLVDLDDPHDAASPLGVACALTFALEVVSQATAAQLLGVSRSRVHTLLAEGKLDRAGKVGVTRTSIARRLAGEPTKTVLVVGDYYSIRDAGSVPNGVNCWSYQGVSAGRHAFEHRNVAQLEWVPLGDEHRVARIRSRAETA